MALESLLTIIVQCFPPGHQMRKNYKTPCINWSPVLSGCLGVEKVSERNEICETSSNLIVMRVVCKIGAEVLVACIALISGFYKSWTEQNRIFSSTFLRKRSLRSVRNEELTRLCAYVPLFKMIPLPFSQHTGKIHWNTTQHFWIWIFFPAEMYIPSPILFHLHIKQ